MIGVCMWWWLYACDHFIILSHFLNHALAWPVKSRCVVIFFSLDFMKSANQIDCILHCIRILLNCTMKKTKILENLCGNRVHKRQFCCCVLFWFVACYWKWRKNRTTNKSYDFFFLTHSCVTFLRGGFTYIVTVNLFFLSLVFV